MALSGPRARSQDVVPKQGVQLATEPGFIQATRTYYDKVAADYAAQFRAELAARPVDRGLLAGFAELVRAAGAAPIADIGCGPGSVTAHLNDLGSSAFGIDLSPQMVDQARQAYPDLRFEVGSMLALDLPDRCLGGIVAWYSIIHVPDEQLPLAFGEFYRVLLPGGHLLMAFQIGTDSAVLHHADVAGDAVSVDLHQRQPDRVAEALSGSGLDLRVRVVGEPDDIRRIPGAGAAGVFAGPPTTGLPRRDLERRPTSTASRCVHPVTTDNARQRRNRNGKDHHQRERHARRSHPGPHR
jgi:ubiquinone/menaquinone biosynthesis C-methylase UbiE